jgi:hypothetical protein
MSNNKPTIKNIIFSWLKRRIQARNYTVSSHHFETELVEYGKMYWGVTRLPSAYSRAWRDIRLKEEYKKIDIVGIKEENNNSPESTWRIEPWSTSKLQSAA